MKSGLVILILAAVMFVGAIYNSSFTFLFVEGIKAIERDPSIAGQNLSVLEAQRANVTILPGGIIQEANTSSNDSSSSGILGMEQSDLVSDEAENKTGTVNDGEEQDESETTEDEQDENVPIKGQAREGADETDDKENIDEELPLE